MTGSFSSRFGDSKDPLTLVWHAINKQKETIGQNLDIEMEKPAQELSLGPHSLRLQVHLGGGQTEPIRGNISLSH